MKIKVAIVGGNSDYRKLFECLGFDVLQRGEAVNEAGLVVFTGGEDVTPKLYGDAAHRYTGNNENRDKMEAAIFKLCAAQDIPMVGICRGGQFLNVMSGGRMLQHCEGHTQAHEIEDLETGETIYVSSTHHQIMLPGDKSKVLAVSVRSVGCEWFDGNIAKRENVDNTAEVVFYPHTKSLCFQPHPEFGSLDDHRYSGMVYYFERLLHQYLIQKVIC